MVHQRLQNFVKQDRAVGISPDFEVKAPPWSLFKHFVIPGERSAFTNLNIIIAFFYLKVIG
jgi:hypothetical protein